MRQESVYEQEDLDEDDEEEEEEDEEDEEEEEEEEDDEGGDDDPGGLQALLNRLGGGLDGLLPNTSRTHGRLKQILAGLRAEGDETRQMGALHSLCEVLVISSEESLITLSIDAFTPVLVQLMQYEHNPDCMLLAARALTSMADILPNSRAAIVHYGALPTFCSRLLTIEYIDLAEQSLQALEKLSQDQGASCLREGGMMACLSYLDFFALGMQRVSLQTVANMCRQLPASDCWELVSDSVPVLTNLLLHDDGRLVESACTCLTLIAANFSARPERLQAMCTHGLIPNATRLISPVSSGGTTVGPSTYRSLIRLIATCCKSSADVAEQLLRNGLPVTLKSVLAGCNVLSTTAASPASPVVSTDQLLEVVTLTNQLLPSIQPGSGASDSPLIALRVDAAAPTSSTTAVVESGGGKSTAETANAGGITLEQILRAEPELLREYGSNLTAALMQVIVASVGSNVRLQCLASLAKFLHHAPPEMLSSGPAALQPGQMASFLAGLVSSRDSAVVQVALYLVDLLMDKLPDTFSRVFRKEGTVHAIEQLCAQKFEEATVDDNNSHSGGNVTPRDKVVPPGVDNESVDFATPIRTGGSCRTVVDTPQRRAAVERAVSLRTAHFNAAATGGAVDLLQKASAPLRTAGSDPETAAAVAIHFLTALDEGEGASTFEFIECGGVNALASYFSGGDLPEEDSWGESIAARLSAFVRAASINLSQKTMRGIVERLLDALAVTEEMPVRLSAGSEGGSSGRGASRSASRGSAGESAASDGLSVLARPFKLRLCRATGARAGLKEYSSNVILVEPLATLTAIEDFLYPRVHKPESAAATSTASAASGEAENSHDVARQPNGPSEKKDADTKAETAQQADEDDEEDDNVEEEDEEEVIDDDAEEEEEDIPRAEQVEDVDPAERSASPSTPSTTAAAVAAAAPPRLLFHASGVDPFHPATSVLQAVHAAALAAAATENGTHAREAGDDAEGGRLSTASLWEKTHTLYYAIPVDGQALPPPPPSSGAGAAAAVMDSSDATEALAAFGPRDRRAALGSVLPALRGKLCGDAPPSGLTDTVKSILSVLSVFHRIITSAPRLFALGDVEDENVTATNINAALALPSDAFLSSKLAGKMVRQLQDTLALCTGSLPAWCTVIARSCPFLFPFEARQQLFYCTTFGLARALHRLHGQTQENGGGGGNGGAGGRELRVGRLQRQKVRVSRERILESAVKVFDMTGAHKMVLEVEFFNEVGTGTGPTLEFYTLLSKELTQRALGAWRDVPNADGTGSDIKYVNAPHGLFPAPVSSSAYDVAPPGSPGKLTRGDLFRLLGRVVGKALQDGRLLDLGLSPAFFRAITGRTLALADLSEIDPELGRTLTQLSTAARRIDALKKAGADFPSVTVGGAAIEDLCMTFTLPGDDAFELKPGGADVAITAENIAEYVDAVVDATVGGGVARQIDAFRSGLSDILPPQALVVFSEAELDCMLCGQGQKWTTELLSECVTYDHGYTAQSPPIRSLMETMCGFGPEEQRSFLRFVTGAPRMPPGGLAALQPRLTVVCKQPSGGGGGASTRQLAEGTVLADKDLPSAMTCASYLKLPPYSRVEVLKERLTYAITEGVASFDLS
jgi:E3 ubiquitin-protein ligase TRIP12